VLTMNKITMGIMMAAVMAVTLCSADGVFADDDYDRMPPPGHHRMEGPGRWDPFEGIDLTAEQRDKLKAHREANMKNMKEIRQQMKEEKDALKDEFGKDVIDDARIAKIASELKKLSAQMVDQRINSILSLREILTPVQFQKMHARMEEKMSKRGEKGRGWHRGGTDREGPGDREMDRDMPPPPPDEE